MLLRGSGSLLKVSLEVYSASLGEKPTDSQGRGRRLRPKDLPEAYTPPNVPK